MKKILSLILILGVAFPAISVAMEKDKDEIYNVISTHYKNVNEGNTAAIKDLLTPDVVFMIPFGPEVEGKEKVIPISEKTHDTMDFDFHYQVDEIIISGDWAFTRSTVQGFLVHKKSEAGILDEMKAIHILQKQSDGTWKIARFIYNPSTPL